MRTTLLLLIGGVLLALSPILVTAKPSPWDQWKPATCMSDGCFCEKVRSDDLIRQPVNTWSSLAFVLAGSAIFLSDQKRRKSALRLRLSKASVFLLALSTVVIGIGSAFFHASLTLVGQFFDVFGMYLLTSFMLAYALQRLFRWNDGLMVAFYISINLLLSGLLYEVPETRRYVFAIVLLLAIIFEMLVRRLRTTQIAVRWWNSGLMLFLIGYVIWILDNTRVLCSPNSLLQGHSVWHILGAVAVFCLFRYYSSEERGAEPESA
jgi:hypothetical protein